MNKQGCLFRGTFSHLLVMASLEKWYHPQEHLFLRQLVELLEGYAQRLVWPFYVHFPRQDLLAIPAQGKERMLEFHQLHSRSILLLLLQYRMQATHQNGILLPPRLILLLQQTLFLILDFGLHAYQLFSFQ